MADITTRAGKGSPLTNTEVDANFTNLNDAIATLVESVNGETGVVTLNPDHLDDAASLHKFISATELSKLAGIEANATADQTGAEIKTLYEQQAETNAFTNAEKDKLATVETNADQTDTANVNAAGAVMESDISGTPLGRIIDDDTMATANSTSAPSSESVKVYVDAHTGDDTIHYVVSAIDHTAISLQKHLTPP